MNRINQHIEIVSTSLRDLSSMSRVSRDGVFDILSKYYRDVRITLVNNLASLDKLVARKPDLVFLGVKYIPSGAHPGKHNQNKIWIADYLGEHDIAYTGSSQAAHHLELNKHLAKQRAIDNDIKTSPFIVIRQSDPMPYLTDSLAFPVFIKPTNRGGGLGVDSKSIAANKEQLRAKVTSISTELHSDSLIEEYLPGREFSVAILKDEFSENFSVMPIELVAELNEQGTRLLGKELKSSNSELILEVTDLVIKNKITILALEIFHALGAQDYGRVDIRLDKNGIPHFLEANLIPSLIDGYGSFPKACALNIGMNHESMILSIVRIALGRNDSSTVDLDNFEAYNSQTIETIFEP